MSETVSLCVHILPFIYTISFRSIFGTFAGLFSLSLTFTIDKMPGRYGEFGIFTTSAVLCLAITHHNGSRTGMSIEQGRRVEWQYPFTFRDLVACFP